MANFQPNWNFVLPLELKGKCNECLPKKIKVAKNVSVANVTLAVITECLPAVAASQAVDMPEFVQCLK